MSKSFGEDVPWIVRSVWPPIVLLAAFAGMFVWSSTYNATARMVPMLVAGTMFVLAAFDLVSRFPSRRLDGLRDFWGADFRNPEMRHSPPVAGEVTLAAIFVALVAVMMTIGILPTLPFFIVAYMVLFGRRGWLESLVVAAVVFAFVYAVFEVLLDYRLYRGVVFDERGFDSW